MMNLSVLKEALTWHAQTRALLKEATIKPAANQCELSVAVPQFELVDVSAQQFDCGAGFDM